MKTASYKTPMQRMDMHSTPENAYSPGGVCNSSCVFIFRW